MDAELIKIIPSVLWFIFAVGLGWHFRNRINGFIEVVAWRLKAGAPFEVSNFKMGAIQISPLTKRPEAGRTGSFRQDNGDFHKMRQSLRDLNIFIVHKIAPSEKNDQLYDVLIYLVTGLRYGNLSGVKSVEYYFGSYWDKNVFEVVDRPSGFSISTSAFAPFTCTARILFSDGRTAILHRLIDFEMGVIGTVR